MWQEVEAVLRQAVVEQVAYWKVQLALFPAQSRLLSARGALVVQDSWPVRQRVQMGEIPQYSETLQSAAAAQAPGITRV